MPKYTVNLATKTTIVLLAVSCSLVGCALGLIDPNDHVTVGPTESPDGMVVSPSAERLSINEAKREVQIVKESTERWLGWRQEDIAKKERVVTTLEAAFGGAVDGLLGAATPFLAGAAPTLALLAGYATKRRKDMTPEEVAKEKEASYNAARKHTVDLLRKAGVSVPDDFDNQS